MNNVHNVKDERFRKAKLGCFSEKPGTAKKAKEFLPRAASNPERHTRSKADAHKCWAHMRDFHERQLLRIVDLYKSTRDPVEVASQLSNLRRTLAIQAFRFASVEHAGNYALVVGGSVVKGDHTFLTDLDVVVVPSSEEDREAGLRVQALMSRVLADWGVEADAVMPFHFGSLPFEKLETKFTLVPRDDCSDPFLASKRLSEGAYFRFAMDIQVIDTHGRNSRAFYREKLDSLQQKTIYDRAKLAFELIEDGYRLLVEEAPNRENGMIIGIKKEALRPFYLALYAARVKTETKTSSPWKTIGRLQKLGIVSNEDKTAAISALNFFLEIRHIISTACLDAKDSTNLDEQNLPAVLAAIKMDRRQFLEKIEISRQTLRNISDKIFSQIKGGENAVSDRSARVV